MNINDRVTIKEGGAFSGMTGTIVAKDGDVYSVLLDDGRERGFAGFELAGA
jgi:ribosomal protein L21E